THHENVERRLQCCGHFARDRNAAPGQCQDENVQTIFVMLKVFRQQPAGLSSVSEAHLGSPDGKFYFIILDGGGRTTSKSAASRVATCPTSDPNEIVSFSPG